MAIDRRTRNVVGWETGDRGEKTAKKLWRKIKDIDCEKYWTDYWKPYKKVLPQVKHGQSKAETYTVEGWEQPVATLYCKISQKNTLLLEDETYGGSYTHSFS